MHALDEQYLTIAEAATLLRVAPSTVRRWIREGDVPAYRLGRRRVALRRADLATLITPVQAMPQNGASTDNEPILHRKLTPEEKQQAREAMERLQRLNEEILARRGGKPFPDSLEIIDEMREERTRQLLG